MEQSSPVFRYGSSKWIGLKKWGFYFNMFLTIADGNNSGLKLTPREYLDHWAWNPRIMTILSTIQRRVRYNTGKQLDDAKKKRKPPRRRSFKGGIC